MKRRFSIVRLVGLAGCVLALGVLLVGAASAASAAGQSQSIAPRSNLAAIAASTITTTFTYQGQLRQGGAAVSGSCNMAFRLYDAPSAGNLIGSPITTTVPINNGLFTAGLNFGNNAFMGSARWLDIRVRCPAGTGSYITLTPRQQITAAPYALAPWVTSGSTIYYSSGNAGIGTTNPSALLSVVKSGATEPTAYGVPVGLKVGTASGTVPFAVRQNAAEISTPALALFETSDGDLGGFGANPSTFVVGAAASHGLGFNVDGSIRAMSIGSDGRVGIGGSPVSFSRLNVQGSGLPQDISLLRLADSTGSEVFSVLINGSVHVGHLSTSGTSALPLCRDNNGYISACSSVAEYVPTIDRGLGFPEAADLVSIDPATHNPYGDEHSPFVVGKSEKACDPNLLGYVLQPQLGAAGNKLNDHYLPLAIYGYFPAKVTLENGAIKRGDPLTSSSKPGYAMKATQACKIIGYALEDANAERTIQVFAHLSESTTTQVAALNKQLDELKAQNAELGARLMALEKAMQAGGTP